MTDTLTPGSEWLLPVTLKHVSRNQKTAVTFFGFEHDESEVLIPLNLHSLIPASRLTDLEAEVGRLREALQAMVDEKCDYMLINHLGDPEGTHTVKHARVALSPKD